MKNNILVILGPTATGKSDLAVTIAKQYNGEIISADSRQVYKGLDIGSGKITKTEMKGAQHHLLDVVSPRTVFTVADFKKKANKAILDIVKRGKIPILCGGTAQYIDAVIFDQNIPEVKPNKKLRKELKNKTTKELSTILWKLDRRRHKEIDKSNPVRLIRAIEIAKSIGKVPQLNESKEAYNTLWIGLDWPQNILEQRINARLSKRVEQGMVAEGKKIHAAGISYKRMEQLGLEYRYLARFLKKEISKDDMLHELKIKIRQFVKRQRTWWKRNKKITWFRPDNINEIQMYVRNFLQ